MQLVFATHNQHKFEEVKQLMPSHIQLISLSEIGCHEDIPETSSTITGNAALKAQYVFNTYGLACFADDTGLEVRALRGAPGVYSARYAGESGNSEKNIKKLLKELEPLSDRCARFKTVIALRSATNDCYFTGTVRGIITHQPRGTGGFGYDSVFQPEGYLYTFAELPLKTKNLVSHRARALAQLLDYLKK